MTTTQYRLNREGNLISDTERQCTNCRMMFPKTSKTVTLCGKCNSARVKSSSAESRMLARAKARSTHRQSICSLTVADIVIPERCPVLDIPLVCHSGSPGGKYNSPSLDRIDTTIDYAPGNVQVISQLANSMKSFATPSQLLKFADWVYRTYEEIPEDRLTLILEHKD